MRGDVAQGSSSSDPLPEASGDSDGQVCSSGPLTGSSTLPLQVEIAANAAHVRKVLGIFCGQSADVDPGSSAGFPSPSDSPAFKKLDDRSSPTYDDDMALQQFLEDEQEDMNNEACKPRRGNH